ncbi:MAG: hypothetical protein GXO90_10425 [FCB group bacterium]|nr:hypothetical protein [FCB group bacterium]
MNASHKSHWIFPFFLFITLGFSQTQSLYILHTNNTNGALENCYCPDHPLGSIEKRTPFVESFRQEHDAVLLLDAGDFLSPVNRPYKDSLVCEGYAILEYDAILPGDQELNRDRKTIIDHFSRVQAPIVATNLVKPKLPGVVPYLVIPVNGIRIAILGIIDPQAFKYYPKEIQDSVEFRNPVNAVKATLREIYPLPDVVVLLSHSGYDQDQLLAGAVSGIDVIIGGHSQTVVKDPVKTENTLIVQAGKEGYYTGVVEIKLDAQHKITSTSGYLVPMTLEMPDDPRIMNLITAFEKHSGYVNKRKLKLKGQ